MCIDDILCYNLFNKRGDLIMFDKKIKRILCFIFSVLSLTIFFACGNTSGYSTEPTSESMRDSNSDESGMPLSDKEMYSVVFENLSGTVNADENGNYPELDISAGEAYFSFSTENSFDVTYKCSGITSDMEFSDDYSLFHIETTEITDYFYSTPRVNNAYWQQYFKVMLDNIEFASSDETQYGYYVLVNLFGNRKKYMICEDGYVRIEQDDNTILKSDKKVDAPKIFLIALLFRRVQQSAPYDQNYYLTYSNETPFRLHEKTITVKKEEVEKLGFSKDKLYEVKKVYINEKILPTIDVIYFDIRENRYGMIDKENNVYHVFDFYGITIVGGRVRVNYQDVSLLKTEFKYSEFAELFK